MQSLAYLLLVAVVCVSYSTAQLHHTATSYSSQHQDYDTGVSAYWDRQQYIPPPKKGRPNPMMQSLQQAAGAFTDLLGGLGSGLNGAFTFRMLLVGVIGIILAIGILGLLYSLLPPIDNSADTTTTTGSGREMEFSEWDLKHSAWLEQDHLTGEDLPWSKLLKSEEVEEFF